MVIKTALRPTSTGEQVINFSFAGNGKTTLLSSGIRISSKRSFKNGQIVGEPNAAYNNAKLLQQLIDYQKAYDSLSDDEKSLGVVDIVKLLNPKQRDRRENFVEFAQTVVDDYQRQERGSWKTKQYAVSKFNSRFGHVSIAGLNRTTLNEFIEDMRASKLNETSVSLCVREIKTIYYKAQEKGLVSRDNDPFFKFKLPKWNNREVALSVEQIRAIRDVELVHKTDSIARDVFMLIFYLGGVNFIDLVNLKPAVNGRLSYSRHKTEATKKQNIPVSIAIQPEVIEIVKKYKGMDTLLDFGYHFSSYQNMRSLVNHRLKKVAEKAAEMPNGVVVHDDYSLLFGSVITGANGIRNIGNATAKTNVIDLMKSLQKIFGFGWHYRSDGVAGHVDILPARQFYQKDNMIADVGQAFNLQVASIENIYSEVQVGYDKSSDDEVNGIYEFNCKNTFGVASKFTEKSMDLVSKLRADMYGFEQQVREIMDEDKKTTVKLTEDDLWIIDAVLDEYPYALNRNRGNYSGAVAGNTLFNLHYSPKHMLSRNAGLVAAATYPKPNLTYNSSERSSDLQSMVGGIMQPERGDMDMSQYKPYFLPFSFLFYTHYDVQLIAKLKSNPYGYIQFHWEGLTMRGFIYPDVVVFPGPKKEVKWQLIAHPDSNMQEILTKYDAAGRLKSLWR